MKILAEAQHTKEWDAARRGRITASMAHVPMMGRGTKTRRLYVEKIADDLDGIPDFEDHDVKPWFVDGIYYESWARGWYAFKYDREVRQIGFAVHDDYQFIGCSPDGLIDDDGGIEIKYRKTLRTFKEHSALGVNKPVYAQVQASMFVCDRPWWDYVNYWRSDDHQIERGFVERIYRDQAYIDNTLLPAIASFWEDVVAERRRRELQRRRAAG